MPRPQKCRRVCREPKYDAFSPNGRKGTDCVELTVDEYEVIRLVDYEKNTHEQCSQIMNISRTTVTEIYESARYKLSDVLVNGRQLRIGGGNYHLCDGSAIKSCGKMCKRAVQLNGCMNSKMEKKGEGRAFLEGTPAQACGEHGCGKHE